MLAVKPIYDPALREELCALCGVALGPDSYAYFAADVNDDASKINFIIGICTFRMKGTDNVIEALAPAPGVEDEEALMIMARAVMNFMYRAGVQEVRLDACGTDRNTAEKLGFREAENMTIDLPKFYASPCKYTGSK